MKQYQDFLRHILTKGTKKTDRTGTGTISTFGYQMRFDLAEGFPLVTTKKMHTKSIIHELLWFLKGDTNIKYLQENGVTIWDEWADKDGNIGDYAYGRMWTDYPVLDYDDHTQPGTRFKRGGVDQIMTAINMIQRNPDSRRIIVSAWHPAYVEKPYVALPPCHTLFQFYVNDGKLSCQLYQRSADALLGVPFNIASYALLTMMIAKECYLELGEFVHTFGDAHIYLNHLEQVELQLSREPKPLPKMVFERQIWGNYKYEDFKLEGYECHPAIKAPIAV